MREADRFSAGACFFYRRNAGANLISVLEKERQSVYNRNRHKKSSELNAQARAISSKIKPLREELSTAKAILAKLPKVKELLETERQMESAVISKHKERRHER